MWWGGGDRPAVGLIVLESGKRRACFSAQFGELEEETGLSVAAVMEQGLMYNVA